MGVGGEVVGAEAEVVVAGVGGDVFVGELFCEGDGVGVFDGEEAAVFLVSPVAGMLRSARYCLRRVRRSRS